jgi:1-acyl-sn-glycerol-3-phosphate acyltransferase
MPTSLAKLYGLVKGSLAIYCISTCSIVLVIFYVVFVAPFMILSKSFERRLQEVVQRGWVYLLLGVTENVANSQLLMTLPEECGPEMEALVYHKLKTGFEFGFDEEQRLSKLPVPQSERGDMKRDIVISNHQIYMDWIYIWAIMARLRREGNVKIILKRSLLNIPIFGLVRFPKWSFIIACL